MGDLYHKHMTQRVPSDPHWAVNCTAYCAAMLIGDATLGGVTITGRQVRAESNEPKPEPGSPGLNITQVIDVARRHHVRLTDNTRQPWDDLIMAVRGGRRVMLQVEYKELGTKRCQAGGDFGHALVVVRVLEDGKLRASDPLCANTNTYPADLIHEAARVFARRTGVKTGLRWCSTRVVPETVVPWETKPY